MQPGIRGRDEQRHDPDLRAELRSELEGALVTVVAVRDQQAAIAERARLEVREAPEPRAVRFEIGSPVRERVLELPFQEQEDRLRLDSRGAEQAEPLLADAGMRPLVRQHVTRLVRLGRERDDHSTALSPDPVGADVLLREKPRGRLVLAREDSLREPVAVQVDGLLGRLGKCQVGDVVRAAGEELVALLGADCVVGRCDEIDERAGRAGVPDGAKRLQVAHRGERTNGFDS